MSTGSEHQESPFFTPPKRVQLGDRILALFAPGEDPQDNIEAQELRQLVHWALQELTPDELRVIELRYQHKQSPGQVASRLGISREELQELESKGLGKLRRHLQSWHQGL